MKKTLLSILLFIAIAAPTGCVYYVVDLNPPLPPTGVYSVTGDGQVTVRWNASPEPDVVLYRIYWSYYTDYDYQELEDSPVSVSQALFVDTDVVNGYTYYYAVSAEDASGNESELSFELVDDTPRPEGENVRLEDVDAAAVPQGYSFRLNGLQDTTLSEFWFTATAGDVLHLVAGVTGYDAGAIALESIDVASSSAVWTADSLPIVLDHAYVLKIFHPISNKYNYAKIKITALADDGIRYLTFDWAYQLQSDCRELAPALVTGR